jgi:hypothetical protein
LRGARLEIKPTFSTAHQVLKSDESIGITIGAIKQASTRRLGRRFQFCKRQHVSFARLHLSAVQDEP